jgi:hypothetical protein
VAEDQEQLNEFPVKFKQLRIMELTTLSTTRSRFLSTLDVDEKQQATLRRQRDGIQRFGGPRPFFNNAQNDVMQPESTTQQRNSTQLLIWIRNNLNFKKSVKKHYKKTDVGGISSPGQHCGRAGRRRLCRTVVATWFHQRWSSCLKSDVQPALATLTIMACRRYRERTPMSL